MISDRDINAEFEKTFISSDILIFIDDSWMMQN